MAINKVALDGTTLIDLSTDTVTSASDIVSGKVGHLNDGTVVTGTASGGSANIIKVGNSYNGSIQLSNGSWFLPNYSSNSLGKFRSDSETDISINLSINDFYFRNVIKVKLINDVTGSPDLISFVNSSNAILGFGINNNRQFNLTVGKDTYIYGTLILQPIELNTWYYIGINFNQRNVILFLYNNDGQLITYKEYTVPNIVKLSGNSILSLCEVSPNGNRHLYTEIDLSETFFEYQDEIIWGQTNSKTENMGIITE